MRWTISKRQIMEVIEVDYVKETNKLGLSCAKLRPAYNSYPLVFR